MHRLSSSCRHFASAPVSPVLGRILPVPLGGPFLASAATATVFGRRCGHHYSRSAPAAFSLNASCRTFPLRRKNYGDLTSFRLPSSLSSGGVAVSVPPLPLWHQRRFKTAASATAVEAGGSAAAPADGAANNHAGPQEWREYWDMQQKAPYYHNIVTNETTTVCPVGFKSEYVGYYARIAEAHAGSPAHPHDHAASGTEAPRGGAAAAEGAASEKSSCTNDDANGNGKTKPKSLKDRVKEYGPAGVALYLVIHFSCAGVIFLAMVFGVDVTAIARKVGFNVHAEGTSWPALWVAAILVNKLFVPFQAALTLALAPKVTPLLRRLLARFGIGVKPAAGASVGEASSASAAVKPPAAH